MNDTSIQRVPPKHLYPLADRKEINGVVILRLPVLQDLLVCWPRSVGNVGSQERMGHPVEPWNAHTVSPTPPAFRRQLRRRPLASSRRSLRLPALSDACWLVACHVPVNNRNRNRLICETNEKTKKIALLIQFGSSFPKLGWRCFR